MNEIKKLLIDGDVYLSPSPAGAYYCVSGMKQNPARAFLDRLLREKISPALNDENLLRLTQYKSLDEATDLLHHVQKLGWIEGLKSPVEAPSGRLEDILPKVLPKFSEDGKILLADAQGFYVSSSGFSHEVAEELSAMSANIATLHQRYQDVLNKNLGENSSAWSLVDATGNSQIGFWPIFIDNSQFMLIINGLPRLNQRALTTLVWALNTRYGKTKSIMSTLLAMSQKNKADGVDENL